MDKKQKRTILITVGACGLAVIVAVVVIVILLFSHEGSSQETSSLTISQTEAESRISPVSETEEQATASETPEETETIPVESMTLSTNALTLQVGQSQMPIVTMSPSDATDQSEVWSSSAEGIATVDSQGRITGVSPGQCVVTVTSASNPSVSERVDVTVVAAQISSQASSSAPESSSNANTGASTGNGQSAPAGSTGGNTGNSDGPLIVDNGITDAMIADFNARAPHIIELAYEKLASIDCSPCRDYIDVNQNPNEYAFQSLPDADTYLCNWADSRIYTYDWTDEECAEHLVEEVLTTRRLFGISVTGAQFEYLGAYYSDSTLGINYTDGYPTFRVFCFNQYL